MPGFFIAWYLAGSIISRLGLGSLGRTQSTHLLWIRQQRPINLDAITSLNHPRISIGDHLAENPYRTSRQIQLGELGTDAGRRTRDESGSHA